MTIDIKNDRYEVFGEEEKYKNRIYLLYSGVHYDIGVKIPKEGEEWYDFLNVTIYSYSSEIRVFDPSDE